MMICPTVRKDDIRRHYDLTTIFYRLLWGRHIHHGLWDGSESPRVAQRHLTETLARLAGLTASDRVLDIGCGMGGSSVQLARKLGCHVTGVTISPFQRRWAATAARFHGAGEKTRFLCADAEAVDFEPHSFDVVWSIECTEHLFDKPRFFLRAADWLRPGGRLAVCAWLAADQLTEQADILRLHDVCEGFLCPSLGSRIDYSAWMRNAGFTELQYEDWTDRVARTWEICLRRVRRTGMRWLAHLFDESTVRFLERFETILEAYRTGVMRYGCFVARRLE